MDKDWKTLRDGQKKDSNRSFKAMDKDWKVLHDGQKDASKRSQKAMDSDWKAYIKAGKKSKGKR